MRPGRYQPGEAIQSVLAFQREMNVKMEFYFARIGVKSHLALEVEKEDCRRHGGVRRRRWGGVSEMNEAGPVPLKRCIRGERERESGRIEVEWEEKRVDRGGGLAGREGDETSPDEGRERGSKRTGETDKQSGRETNQERVNGNRKRVPACERKKGVVENGRSADTETVGEVEVELVRRCGDEPERM